MSYFTASSKQKDALNANCYQAVSANKLTYYVFRNIDNRQCLIEDTILAKWKNHGTTNHVEYVKGAKVFYQQNANKNRDCGKLLDKLLKLVKLADEAYWTPGAFADVVFFTQVIGGGKWSKGRASDAFAQFYGDASLANELHWQSFTENLVDILVYIGKSPTWKQLQSKSKYVARALCSCSEYMPTAKSPCRAWSTYVTKCRKADFSQNTPQECKQAKLNNKLKVLFKQCLEKPSAASAKHVPQRPDAKAIDLIGRGFYKVTLPFGSHLSQLSR